MGEAIKDYWASDTVVTGLLLQTVMSLLSGLPPHRPLLVAHGTDYHITDYCS
jgi:hypothetical protein